MARPGLGARAHAGFGIPVIGVAKSRFRAATHAVPVVRGSSARPLFVTAAGMPSADAADVVRAWPAGTGCPTLPSYLRGTTSAGCGCSQRGGRAEHKPPGYELAGEASNSEHSIEWAGTPTAIVLLLLHIA